MKHEQAKPVSVEMMTAVMTEAGQMKQRWRRRKRTFILSVILTILLALLQSRIVVSSVPSNGL